ncbi:MAG: glycosyltransferase family 1 protein [Acidobacteriota bacterium]
MVYRIAIDARKIRDFGIGTYIRNLVRELASLDSDHRYFLITGPQSVDALDDLPEHFEVVVHGAPVYSIREMGSLSALLRRLKVDLYHATHYVLPIWLPRKTVVTIHDIIHLLYPEYLPNRLAFFYAERMIRRSLLRSDRVLTVSENTKSDLEKYFSIDGSNIEVVHNGIEDEFHVALDGPTLADRLASLGLEPGYFLFVGNPKPHKNLDNVVKAYAKAVETEGLEQSLVCVGDRSSIESRVRQRAEQLGIDDRLILLGHVDQELLPAVYQGASLFLYPTLYEGFGLPVVEAMASNVPVITSNTSALKEIAAGYAHLVNPLDLEAMTAAIVQCVKDRDHRTSLRKVGKRRSQDFSWEVAARRTLAVYEKCLGSDS